MRQGKALLLWLFVIAAIAAALDLYGHRMPWSGRTGPSTPPPATGDTISGRPRVVDGDSLEIAGHRIRLFGIDAPEGPQHCRDAQGRDYACGQEARRTLASLVGGRTVNCNPVGESHDRDVAICRVNGIDLSEAMVRGGHALELLRFSEGRYSSAEREARDNRRGIWAGRFERPSDWRNRR